MVERFLEAEANVVEGIFGGWNTDRVATVGADEAEESIAVHITDFSRRKRLGYIDQFVAAAQNGDARAALDAHLRLAECCQHTEFLRADDCACGQDGLP